MGKEGNHDEGYGTLMAVRPKSICRHAACGTAIDAPGYCAKHKADATGWNATNRDRSNTERGYGWAWRKARDAIMHRDCGLCQPCYRLGRISAAREVDHIVSKAKAARLGWTETATNEPSNLQAICTPCHQAKTARDRAEG